MKQLSEIMAIRYTLCFLSMVSIQVVSAQNTTTSAATSDENDKPVWQVGVHDGYPANPSQPVRNKEFGRLTAAGNFVSIGGTSAFPQRIQTDQTIAMRFAKLPQKNFRFVIVVNTGTTFEKAFPWVTHPRKQLLSIGFNGVPLTYRYLPDASNTLTVLIPADKIGSTDNIITVKNCGTSVLAVDSAWLALARDRRNIWVGLANADWLGPDQSDEISHSILPFGPNSFELSKDQMRLLQADRKTCVSSLKNRRGSWKQQDWKTIVDSIKKDSNSTKKDSNLLGKQAEEWSARIQKVLARGAEPVIIVKVGSEKHPSWLRLFSLFSRYVRYWYLDYSDMSNAPFHIEALSKICPDIKPSIIFNGKIDLSDKRLQSMNLSVPIRALRTARTGVNNFKQQLATIGVTNSEALSPSVVCRQLGAMQSLEDQYTAAFEFPRFILESLDGGADRVLLYGARFGGALFPQGSSKPAEVWPVLYPLLGLGRGVGERMACNIVAEDNQWFRDVSWCASGHTKSHVDLAVFSHMDAGREARTECLVPWEGNTVVEITPFALGINTKPVAGEVIKLNITADSTGGWGVVRFDHTLANFSFIRMRPKNGRFYQQKTYISTAEKFPSKPVRNTSFKPQFGHFDSGVWIEDLLSGPELTNCSRVGEETTLKMVAATPGRVGNREGIVPWNNKSIAMVIDPAKYSSEKNAGAFFSLNMNRYPEADYIELWAYPKAQKSAAYIPFIMGSRARSEIVSLKVGSWNRIRVRVERLAPVRMSSMLKLFIRPTSDIKRHSSTVELELNAIQLVGTKKADNTVALRPKAVLLDATDNNKVLIISAPAGKPVMLHYKFPAEISPKKIICSHEGVTLKYFPGSKLLRIGFEKLSEGPLPDGFINSMPESSRQKLPPATMGVLGVRVIGK